MIHRPALFSGPVGATLGACGCSSSPATSGVATSSGLVGGHTFAPRDAMALRLNIAPRNSDVTTAATTLEIVISDVAGICGDDQHQTMPGNVSLLIFEFSTSTELTPAPGTCGVDGLGSASAYIDVTGASCTSVFSATATSGTITTATSNDSTISGSFDLRGFMNGNGTGPLGSGDHLTGVLDFSAMRLYPWAPGSPSQVIAVPTQGNAFEQVIVGDVIGWTEGNAAATELRIWTAALGASDFVSFGGDASSGAADIGGDGHDFVWVQGSGRADSTSAYPVVSTMTSLFVTDPHKVVPRRLRSEEAAYYGTAPFVVG